MQLNECMLSKRLFSFASCLHQIQSSHKHEARNNQIVCDVNETMMMMMMSECKL